MRDPGCQYESGIIVMAWPGAALTVAEKDAHISGLAQSIEASKHTIRRHKQFLGTAFETRHPKLPGGGYLYL